MSSNHERAATLVRALRAAVERDRSTLQSVLADDVRAWTPALATGSLAELLDELDRRDESFSEIGLTIDPLDVGGDFAGAEWTVEMTHSGAIAVDSETTVEPTGLRVTLHGVTIAEFAGERICSLRQYWDEMEILEQLGVVDRHESNG